MVRIHRRTEDFGPSVVQGLNLRQRIERGLAFLILAEQSEGGIVTAEAICKPDECLLDQLLSSGALGHDDDAQRRHEAGMWLRTLYHEKAQMAPRSTGHYGEGRGGGDEISDSTAWHRKVYSDTMRAVPRFGHLLTRVCCHDEPHKRVDLVRCGLDALADHRRM